MHKDGLYANGEREQMPVEQDRSHGITLRCTGGREEGVAQLSFHPRAPRPSRPQVPEANPWHSSHQQVLSLLEKVCAFE